MSRPSTASGSSRRHSIRSGRCAGLGRSSTATRRARSSSRSDRWNSRSPLPAPTSTTVNDPGRPSRSSTSPARSATASANAGVCALVEK
jgi:hypothetical protein